MFGQAFDLGVAGMPGPASRDVCQQVRIFVTEDLNLQNDGR